MGANNPVVTEAVRYFLPVMLVLAAGVVTALAVFLIVRTVRRQYKLYNSITLVGLKTPKFVLIAATAALGALGVYSLVLAVSPAAEAGMLNRIYGLNEGLVRLTFVALTVLLFALTALGVAIALTRSCIVDRGVYVGNRFIDWHHIYDYAVDEKRRRVVLSTDKRGPLTLSGTTCALRYNEGDAEKIKFILNKNKNKFIPRYELR